MNKIVKFKGNFVFFNLAQKYRALERQYKHSIPAGEFYEATRRAWPMAEQRLPLIQYAAAVCGGVIRAVYKIQKWEKDAERPDRWKFTGVSAAEQPQADYVGKDADPYMPRTAIYTKRYNF